VGYAGDTMCIYETAWATELAIFFKPDKQLKTICGDH